MLWIKHLLPLLFFLPMMLEINIIISTWRFSILLPTDYSPKLCKPTCQLLSHHSSYQQIFQPEYTQLELLTHSLPTSLRHSLFRHTPKILLWLAVNLLKLLTAQVTLSAELLELPMLMDRHSMQPQLSHTMWPTETHQPTLLTLFFPHPELMLSSVS